VGGERERRDLKRQLDAALRARSLAERRVRTLEWILNLGPFQQVEEQEDEDKGFSLNYFQKQSEPSRNQSLK